MTTLKCAFSWFPEVVQPDALEPSLPSRVALALHEWGRGGKTRLSNQVNDHEIPVKASVRFDGGRDPTAWQDLVEIAAKQSLQCEQLNVGTAWA